MSQPRFLADSMLGTLAKKLRLLGIDTVFIGNAGDGELKYVVRSQDRILLTKDRDLASSLENSAWPVDGGDVREEFTSIAKNLSARGVRPAPFSRCLDCNGLLQSVEPSDVKGIVPPYIHQTKKVFSRCSSCGKIFWEGTHRRRMEKEVNFMKEVLEEKRDKC